MSVILVSRKRSTALVSGHGAQVNTNLYKSKSLRTYLVIRILVISKTDKARISVSGNIKDINMRICKEEISICYILLKKNM